MAETGRLYRIGELARLTGVSARTIRFYSDSGVLPPAKVAASGYRLYAEADRGRLDLIRALRDLGVDLPTIAGLIHERGSVADALALQLEAVEATLRTARRQRTLLRAALDKGGDAALAYLDRARVLARLDAIEREHYLGAQLERVFAGVPVDEGWKAHFWQGAVLDLPDELTEEQFVAWLELADLVGDEEFIARLNAMSRETWASGRARTIDGEEALASQRIYVRAAEAEEAGLSPRSPEGQALVAEYLTAQARIYARPDDPDFPGEFLAMIERNSDPRAASYWQLIGILKGWPARSPIATGHAWLIEGLRWRVGRASA